MRILRILGFVVGGVIGVLALTFAALQTSPGQRALTSIVSSAASTPDRRVELTGLDGFFPTDLRLAHLSLADRNGVWLQIEESRLRWSFLSLLDGRVRIEALSAARIEVLRAPEPSQELDPPKESTDSDDTLGLPIGIDLQSFAVDDLRLAAAVARIDSRWRLKGNALLPADLAEGRLHLTADRADGPSGRLAADLRFDLARRTVDGEIAVDEGQGGIVAALLERPELERVSARLAARGDENAGNADLTLSAGDVARATGKAIWARKGAALSVSAQLDAAGPGLPQGMLADAVRGPISLKAEATVEDKLVTLSEARLSVGPLGVVASGRYDRAGDRLEATATLEAAEPGPFGPLMGGIAWRGLRLQTSIDLADLATRPRGTIALGGGADDLALDALDPRLPRPGKVEFDARAAVRDGKITIETLDLRSPLASAKGGGSFTTATQAADIKATVEIPNLAPVSALAGRPLTGRANIDVTAASDGGDLSLGWQGTVNDLGAPDVPPALVATVNLAGTASLKRDRAWSLSDVKISSEGGSLAISGKGRDATGTLDLSLDLPKLGAFGADFGGTGTASATIGLRSDGTDLKLATELRDLSRGDLRAQRLSLAATASLDAAGGVSGTVEASGDLSGQALSLNGRFARDAAGGLVVPAFQGRWASAVLDVADLAVTAGRTSGHARLKMTRLEDLAAVAAIDIGGSLDAEVTAPSGTSTDRLNVSVRGAGLRSAGLAIGALELGGVIEDPLGASTSDLTLTASRMAGAGGIGGLNATAKGDRRGMDVTLRATGAQTNASLAARVELAGEEIRIGLSRFEGRHEGIPLALSAPTRVSISGQRIVIDPTTMRLGGGRLVARGTLDPVASDLQLELSALPLSLVDSLAPGTGLEGTLQAKVRASGPMAAPRVEATYSAAGVRLRRPDAALLPAVAVQGTASLIGAQATVDARVAAGNATNLSLKGKATLPQGAAPLTASVGVTGALNMAPFAPLLGNDIRNVTGTLRPNLNVEISGGQVSGSGTVDLTNGAIAMPASGLRLDGGEGRLSLQGDVLQVQRLGFKTGRGGSVNVSGSARLDAQQGAVLDLTIASRRALLVNRADLAATISSDIKISGSTANGIDVSGPITIDRAEISIGGQTSVDFPTIEVREINRPGMPSPAAPPPKPRKAPARPAANATPIRLALTVRAPQAVFVRGRGLEAELSGQFEVTGAPAAPAVIGGLTLRRGEFSLAGRRLNFTRGVVTLDNVDAIDPQLDFIASTNVRSTTIQVAITGTPRAPLISVTSVPSLPSDEALALLIFGRPASSLSAFELVQVAQSIAELSGKSPSGGVLGRLRQGLGLDRLSVGSSNSSSQGKNGSDPVSLEAGRYVAPGVYVGARQGATGNSSRGVVQFEILDNVKLEGDVGPGSGGRVGAKMEWDY